MKCLEQGVGDLKVLECNQAVGGKRHELHFLLHPQVPLACTAK